MFVAAIATRRILLERAAIASSNVTVSTDARCVCANAGVGERQADAERTPVTAAGVHHAHPAHLMHPVAPSSLAIAMRLDPAQSSESRHTAPE